MKQFCIGMVGNPNCGKTTLFNALTGSKQHVGNWPGVTVDRKTGEYTYQNCQVEVVDLPGIYSLDVTPNTTSLDEQIAQNYILSDEADLIINIVDASNLERNLYLSTQLLDMDVPVLMVFNMMDIIEENGDKIDIAGLSERFGIDILTIAAAKVQGIDTLKQAINQASIDKHTTSTNITYPHALQQALTRLQPQIKQQLSDVQLNHSRWFSLKLLEGDDFFIHQFSPELIAQAEQDRQHLEQQLGEEIDILVADSRYNFITDVVQQTVVKAKQQQLLLSQRIDRIVLNRLLGIPIFLFIMYLMFMFTINIGSAFIDFFDLLSATLLIDGLGYMLSGWGVPDWLSVLFAKGIGGGVQVVMTFIPIIGFLYLFLSFLEDSGYMARAAFVMDRFMRFIGLPGKSFVPLIVGFGCNVPALMASRTLENQRDRYLTSLMTPFISCGARLPVYALFAAAFFPSNGQNLVFLLYLIGIIIAILTGLLMKYTLLKGEAGYFVMELPPYHLPTVKGVFLHTWERLKGFIIRAGKVIVPMVLIISFLNAWGTDGSFNNDNTDKSILSEIGRGLTPVFAPMGIEEDNWPATVGIFTGVLAKEVVVGTLDAVYSQLDQPIHVDEEPFDLWKGVAAAFASIPANLQQLGQQALDPLGLDVGEIQDQQAFADEQAVSTSTFGAMVNRFDGQAGAFAYLLFILLYTPCIAAIATLYRETGVRWALFVVAWSTTVAYGSATLCYQWLTFSQHPQQTLNWTWFFIGLLSFTIFLLYWRGTRMTKHHLQQSAMTS